MAGPGRFRDGGFDGRMVWFKGDDGAQPGHCRPDAAPRHLYRNAPGGGRDHEAQATGAALDRHRPQRLVNQDVLLRPQGGTGSRVLSSLSGRLPFRGQRSGLQRSALSDDHPQVAAPLPQSLRRGGSRGPAGVSQGPSLFGDDLRLSFGSLRQDPGGLAQRIGPAVTSDEAKAYKGLAAWYGDEAFNHSGRRIRQGAGAHQRDGKLLVDAQARLSRNVPSHFSQASRSLCSPVLWKAQHASDGCDRLDAEPCGKLRRQAHIISGSCIEVLTRP